MILYYNITMTNSRFEVTFLGTNGSNAYNNGKSRKKYGTNSICVAVSAGDETLIFDAGSGISGLGYLRDYYKGKMNLFISHYHVDHLSGLLFYPGMFDPYHKLDIYGSGNPHRVIKKFISPPLHPVNLNETKVNLTFYPLEPGGQIALPDGIKIRTYKLSHPGGSLGYRVEYNNKVFCICTDVGLQDHENDRGLHEFMWKADLLVLDSFFDDGKIIKSWGHSSWRECAEWAKRVKAKKLALFHYDFRFSDSEIGDMESNAKKIFPNTFAAADHMQILV